LAASLAPLFISSSAKLERLLLLLLAHSVFQLRPAKDNASSQLPTLILISLETSTNTGFTFYTLVNVSNVHPSNVHLSEAPAI